MPYKNSPATYTQADGVVEVKTKNQNVKGHQISIGGNSITGTLDFEVKYHEDGVYETLFDTDGTTQKTVDLSANQTFNAEGYVHSFRVTPTSVDAEYKVLILSGVDE